MEYRVHYAIAVNLLALALCSLAQNSAAPPLLGKPEDIRVHGKAFRIERTPAPLVYDFDQDGKKDLLVGEYVGSTNRCRIYRNVGTDASPTFSGYACLRAGGEDAVMDGS